MPSSVARLFRLDGDERDGAEGQEGHRRCGTSSTADQHGDAVLANAAAAAFGERTNPMVDSGNRFRVWKEWWQLRSVTASVYVPWFFVQLCF